MSKNEIATEVVHFNTIKGISDDQLIRIVNDLDTNFLSKTKGYLDTELIKGKEKSWIIIIHWRNMEEGNEAIMEFSTSPLTKEYRSVVDQATVKFHFAAQTQTWKAV